jgi:hypothetical protein
MTSFRSPLFLGDQVITSIVSLHRVVYVANSTAHNDVTKIYNKAVVYNFDKLIFLIKSFSLKW